MSNLLCHPKFTFNNNAIQSLLCRRKLNPCTKSILSKHSTVHQHLFPLLFKYRV